jgi:hypothetical protein
MKWRIAGAMKDTGKDVELMIDAATPSAAEQAAREMGLYVARIEAVIEPPPTAPNAGIAAGAQPGTDPKPTVIEKTSKKIKRRMLACAALALMGPPSCMYGVDLRQDAGTEWAGELYMTAGTLMFLGGVIGFVVTKLQAWWHHG